MWSTLAKLMSTCHLVLKQKGVEWVSQPLVCRVSLHLTGSCSFSMEGVS